MVEGKCLREELRRYTLVCFALSSKCFPYGVGHKNFNP